MCGGLPIHNMPRMYVVLRALSYVLMEKRLTKLGLLIFAFITSLKVSFMVFDFGNLNVVWLVPTHSFCLIIS